MNYFGVCLEIIFSFFHCYLGVVEHFETGQTEPNSNRSNDCKSAEFGSKDQESTEFGLNDRESAKFDRKIVHLPSSVQKWLENSSLIRMIVSRPRTVCFRVVGAG